MFSTHKLCLIDSSFFPRIATWLLKERFSYILLFLFFAIPSSSISEISAEPLTSNNSSFHVIVHGQGKPIILIPGLMSDGRIWNQLVQQLSSRYQLHVVNIAGFAGTPSIEQQSLARVKVDLLNYVSEQARGYWTNNLSRWIALYRTGFYSEQPHNGCRPCAES